MDPTFVLIVVIVSAIVALMAFLLLRRKPDGHARDDAALDYAEGLNYLLAGDQEAALRKLREAVSKDTNNVDAYLKIGDILREAGRVEKAIQVHKYLTVRTGLSPKLQAAILQSLVKDYIAARQFDQALGVIDEVLAQDRSADWAKEMKVKLYEQKEEWEQAYQAYKQLLRSRGRASNGRLALYKVQEGVKLLESGKAKEARHCFKEAIKIAPQSPPAYINLADSYRRENRKSEALKVLKQFVERAPGESYLAFEPIKQLLYEGGVYGEIENLYLDLIEAQPDNLVARLALAELYEKKGELDKAIQTCAQVLEKDPDNELAKKHLVRLYHEAGDNEKAVQEALDLIEQTLKRKQLYRCKACGYESEELFWRCPECLEWETFVKN